jgi:hypothetical protein
VPRPSLGLISEVAAGENPCFTEETGMGSNACNKCRGWPSDSCRARGRRQSEKNMTVLREEDGDYGISPWCWESSDLDPLREARERQLVNTIM